eukprot:353623-Hanusia_phi.AAC.1
MMRAQRCGAGSGLLRGAAAGWYGPAAGTVTDPSGRCCLPRDVFSQVTETVRSPQRGLKPARPGRGPDSVTVERLHREPTVNSARVAGPGPGGAGGPARFVLRRICIATAQPAHPFDLSCF